MKDLHTSSWKMTWRGLSIGVLGPDAPWGVRLPDLLPPHLSRSTPARTLGKSQIDLGY